MRFKRCARCRRWLGRAYFGNGKGRPDGLNPYCYDCANAKGREWAERNPESRQAVLARYNAPRREQNNARLRAWRLANLDRWKEAQRIWSARFPERLAAKDRRYRENHPDRIALKKARYAARVMGAKIEGVPVDRQAIYDRDDGFCHICGLRVPRDDFTLDHITPLKLGGPHVPANLAVAHRSCNSRKGTRILEVTPSLPLS